jgi:OFA family oxalate/formate antiporter-like MFS transporter
MKRIVFVVVGVLVMLFAGFVYAWSVLSGPISAEYPTWSSAALSLNFTLCMTFFCLGALVAGLLSSKISPRFNLLLSGALFLVGFLWVARIDSTTTLYLSFGVLCGAASGAAYNAVISMVPKWFPDSQGTISGILLMGFGASSLIIGTVYTNLTATMDWRHFFTVMGPLTAVIMVIGFLVLRPVPAPASAAGGAGETGRDYNTAQMLRQPNFWLFFFWAVLLTGAGLSVISLASPMASSVGTTASASTISLVVGMISVCNGVGRVIIGALFDRLSTKTVIRLATMGYILSSLLLMAAAAISSFPLLIAAFVTTGLVYGSCPTLSAAFTKKAFGEKYYAVNYSIMNLNLLPASFGSTIAGTLFDKTHTFFSVYIMMLVLCLGGLVCSFLLKTNDPVKAKKA